MTNKTINKEMIAKRLDDKAVFCAYIDSLADSAQEKIDFLETELKRNSSKNNEVLPEWYLREIYHLKNLVWVMQELAIQTNAELQTIRTEL